MKIQKSLSLPNSTVDLTKIGNTIYRIDRNQLYFSHINTAEQCSISLPKTRKECRVDLPSQDISQSTLEGADNNDIVFSQRIPLF